MSHLSRGLILTSSLFVAGLLAYFSSPMRILVPEAPAYAKLLIATLAIGMWFIFLIPFWLPEVVPLSWPRLSLALRWSAGVLLLAATAIAIAFVWQAPAAKWLWVSTGVVAVFAARNIAMAIAIRRANRVQ